MEIVIGVQSGPRELRIEVGESPDEVRRMVEDAFAQERRLFWITDTKGRQICVPVDKITYVEIEKEDAPKHVGFAAHARKG